MLHCRLLVLLAALVASSAHARPSLDSYQDAHRKASSRALHEQRGGMYDVTFSNEEESVLRSLQGDTPVMISRRLPGKSPNQVQRRCIELGLRCAGDVAPPPSKSEKWRGQ